MGTDIIQRTTAGAAPSDSVRERILDTATRLFYHRGIPGTGVDAVTTSAGVAKMSLYRHFGSKDQLIVECLARLDVRYHNCFVDQVENRAGDPAEKLLTVFDVLGEWFASDHFRGCAFINATVELADQQHPAREPVLAHKRRNRDYIEELAQGAGIPNPGTFAKQIMLLIEGAIITALVQHDPGAARDAKQTARTLICCALSTA
jgi:AcrR family transcriptional regulator